MQKLKGDFGSHRDLSKYDPIKESNQLDMEKSFSPQTANFESSKLENQSQNQEKTTNNNLENSKVNQSQNDNNMTMKNAESLKGDSVTPAKESNIDSKIHDTTEQGSEKSATPSSNQQNDQQNDQNNYDHITDKDDLEKLTRIDDSLGRDSIQQSPIAKETLNKEKQNLLSKYASSSENNQAENTNNNQTENTKDKLQGNYGQNNNNETTLNNAETNPSQHQEQNSNSQYYIKPEYRQQLDNLRNQTNSQIPTENNQINPSPETDQSMNNQLAEKYAQNPNESLIQPEETTETLV